MVSLSIYTVKRCPITWLAFDWIVKSNALYTWEFIVPHLSAVTSTHNSGPVPPAAVHSHARTLPPPWCGVHWIMSPSFPSLYCSLVKRVFQDKKNMVALLQKKLYTCPWLVSSIAAQLQVCEWGKVTATHNLWTDVALFLEESNCVFVFVFFCFFFILYNNFNLYYICPKNFVPELGKCFIFKKRLIWPFCSCVLPVVCIYASVFTLIVDFGNDLLISLRVFFLFLFYGIHHVK